MYNVRSAIKKYVEKNGDGSDVEQQILLFSLELRDATDEYAYLLRDYNRYPHLKEDTIAEAKKIMAYQKKIGLEYVCNTRDFRNAIMDECESMQRYVNFAIEHQEEYGYYIAFDIEKINWLKYVYKKRYEKGRIKSQEYKNKYRVNDVDDCLRELGIDLESIEFNNKSSETLADKFKNNELANTILKLAESNNATEIRIYNDKTSLYEKKIFIDNIEYLEMGYSDMQRVHMQGMAQFLISNIKGKKFEITMDTEDCVAIESKENELKSW